jgi:DNA polymerase-1
MEYADLNKLMTTYVIPYKGGMVERETNGKKTVTKRESLLIDGRVHTNFKAHGAETGRFSSTEPNLQNIPSSGDYGKLVRNLFVAPPGYKLVVADYSQIEPRVIASFSEDPILLNNYLSGGDIYTTIGKTMGVDRKAGKVLVLAISYGVGPDKIASSIGCSLQEARDLLSRFEKQFSSIPKYKARVIRFAKQQEPMPYIETLFGRRRYIPDLLSKEQGLLSRAERQAFNTMIQGSAADIMKLALVRAHSCFTNEPDINVILTVHDELVTITPEDRAEETAEAIRQSMEGITLPAFKVPLIADVHIVDKWGEAK